MTIGGSGLSLSRMPSSRPIVAIAAVIVLVAAASGCGADPKGADDAPSSEAPDEAAASTAGSPDAAPAAPAATVADACTAISPAMQRIPGKGAYEEIVAVLAPVVAASDDAAAVFGGLYEAASRAVKTIGTIDYLDVEAEFDSLTSSVVSTCKSAGAPL